MLFWQGLLRKQKKSHHTVFAVTNEFLEVALNICDEGRKIEQIYGAWKLNDIGKRINTLQFVGRDLLESIVHDLAKDNPQRHLLVWKHAGYNFGVMLQMCFPKMQDVITLFDKLKESMTVGEPRFVEETHDNPNYELEGKQVYVMTLRSPFSPEFLGYLSEYWRGVLSAYGLEVVDSKITDLGIARLTFVSHGKIINAHPQLIK